MTTPSQRKPVILVVCTGTSCRSQMAEAFLRRNLGDNYEIVSAGLHPKPIHSLTLQVMKEIGIDLEAEGHHSKAVKEFLGKLSVKCLIVVCAEVEAECPRLFPGATKRLYWPFDDPAATASTSDSPSCQLGVFRKTRDHINEAVCLWAKESASHDPQHNS